MNQQRVRAGVAAAFLFPFVNGCYTYRTAAASRVEPGSNVSFRITDEGRVGLGQRIGPGVLRVNGTVTNASDSLYVIRVASIEFINAGTERWSGEEVRLPSDYVGAVSTRELSRKRAWLAGGVIAAAIAIGVSLVTLVGGGTDRGSDKPPPDPGTT